MAKCFWGDKNKITLKPSNTNVWKKINFTGSSLQQWQIHEKDLDEI